MHTDANELGEIEMNGYPIPGSNLVKSLRFIVKGSKGFEEIPARVPELGKLLKQKRYLQSSQTVSAPKKKAKSPAAAAALSADDDEADYLSTEEKNLTPGNYTPIQTLVGAINTLLDIDDVKTTVNMNTMRVSFEIKDGNTIEGPLLKVLVFPPIDKLDDGTRISPTSPTPLMG